MARAGRHRAGLAALVLALATPALAQPRPDDDARRFLVYPPNKVITFTANDGFFYLHYDGLRQEKGRDRKGNPLFYNQVVQVTRYPSEDQAVAACTGVRDVPIKGKTVRPIEGFPCAFVQETTDVLGDRVTYYRSSWYAKGRYFVTLGETAEPRCMLPPSPPVGPLLAALGGAPPATPPTADIQVTVVPEAPGAGSSKINVRIEGNTISVTDESGNQRVLTLVPAKKVELPAFTPPTVSGEAKALERFVVTHMAEASYAHLSPELRKTFVSGMPMPSEMIGQATISAAQATLEAGESAANWVRNNPADAGLLGLSVAVGLAFPLSAFANPTVAVGGAALLRGVVGGAMVAGNHRLRV